MFLASELLKKQLLSEERFPAKRSIPYRALRGRRMIACYCRVSSRDQKHDSQKAEITRLEQQLGGLTQAISERDDLRDKVQDMDKELTDAKMKAKGLTHIHPRVQRGLP